MGKFIVNIIVNILTIFSAYYAVQPPHMFFTKIELTVMRNFTTWAFKKQKRIMLPGPAAWYPEGYEFEKHGFYLDEDVDGAFRAWKLLQKKRKTADFTWVLPSETVLTCLPRTLEAVDFLNEFYLK